MTNAEFGKRIGVTESYASYIRRGERKPSANVLVELIDAFDFDARELMRAYRAGGDALRVFFDRHTPLID